MRRIKWVPMVVATAALLALAACSNGSGDDGVASLGGDQAAGDATPSPSVSDEEALQAFAECMRDNGIEDFPDLQIDEDGGFAFQAGSDDQGPPQPEDRKRLDEAMRACEDLLPEGTGPDSISPEEEAELQDAFLEYAQCMRDHGIDMPDPEFSDGGVAIGGGDADPNSEAFQEADEACNHFLGDIGVEREEAPGG
jgi:hypothetical protein